MKVEFLINNQKRNVKMNNAVIPGRWQIINNRRSMTWQSTLIKRK